MDTSSVVFFSNRLEQLYVHLKETIFSSSRPFVKRLIIVPSPAMKTWLMFRLARDLQIAMGIEVGYIDQTLNKLISLFSAENSTRNPSILELSLNLEVELRNLLKEGHSLDSEKMAILQPLFEYLKVKDKENLKKNISKKTEKRLMALAEKLALLFNDYGKYGGSLIKRWHKEPLSHWQQQLWMNLEQKFHPWGYPYRQLESFTFHQTHCEIEIHVFALSYLSPLHHRFLKKAGNAISVNYYHLSPCQEFWTDILSEKESHYLKNYWRKEGASPNQRFALDEYLRDTNPLLANFGRLGREMAYQMEESDFLTEESYLLPEALTEKEAYTHLLSSEQLYQKSHRELSLLEAVQADIALLRQPEDKIEFSSCDDSIQIHKTSRRMQEVQVLYNALLKAIEKHSSELSPIQPGDIVVMAPNIMDYEPYIHSVFGSLESQLDFHIMDLQMPAKSLIVQAFLHLLNLPSGRWDASSILKLLNYQVFQKRHSLTPEDIQHIRYWIKESGILWGKDRSHRNDILKRNYCEKEIIAEDEVGTWENGFNRILSGLALLFEDSEFSEFDTPFLPLDICEMTQAELLGKFIHLFRSLYDDLSPIEKGHYLSLKEWSAYLKNLLETYLFPTNESEKENYSILVGQIEAFEIASGEIKEETFSFQSIKFRLEAQLTKESISYKETHLHAVKFCSLLPMRSIPAKIIGLLGMQEEDFPRKADSFSLNLLRDDPEADYHPSPTDFDRYLFLEALLSARQYFIISFVGQTKSLVNQNLPSLLVQELLGYLDQAYLVDKKKPSDCCLFHHPFLSFDKAYFTRNSPISSYSPRLYEEALSYYQIQKREPHQFIPHFHIKEKVLPHEIVLNIKDLNAFAKDPIKAYFNRSLGIYLEKEEDRLIKDEEDFQISNLSRAKLVKKILSIPLNATFNRAEKEGDLPVGPFKKLNWDKVGNEVDKLRTNLNRLGIATEQFFTVEFDENCREATLSNNGWKVPALMIQSHNGASIKIVGHLPNVTEKGLVGFAKEDAIETVKLFPQILIYSCLMTLQGLPPLGNQFVFAKSGKTRVLNFDNPHQLLANYVDYYFVGMKNLSPLIPEWVFHLLSLSKAEFNKEIYRLWKRDKSPKYYDYLKWLDQGSIESWLTIAENWNQMAHHVFGELCFHWFPKLKKNEDTHAEF